ncbi:MAG: lytic transglycosylase F [Thermoanaerobaculales bacterium]|jgi:membrane-bound lytic murein transglycosylase MltF|nr:lytic transglycosylase F [Thermoanaerobaculales bacterium]
MKIGRLLCRAAVAAVVFTASACGGSDGDERPPAPADVEPSSAAADASEPLLELAEYEAGLGSLAEWRGDFDDMVERGFIRVLVVPSRTHYFLDGATQRGLSYEGLREFESFLEQKLGHPTVGVRVAIVPVRRDEVLPALERGLGDFAAANLTVTPERSEVVDFAFPFADNVRELVVTGPSGPALAELDDLSGAEVHVRMSSSFRDSLEAVNDDFASRGLEPIRIVPVEEYLETEDLLELVDAGVFPATVADEHIARFWDEVLDHVTVHTELPIREGSAIAWAVRSDAPGLTEVVSEFARKHRVGTLTTNVLLNRYLRDNTWARDGLEGRDQERLEATAEFFRTYGARYGFDPLMLTALAYQESRLDQSKRSRAGAVGVMQIKPATAADRNVGIADIDQVDNNIHAGVKYLAFLRDRYFTEAEIEPFDRTMLTFAAYNAGPARVAALRKEARDTGLDPNRWFGHVESIAARRVGRETVLYVANITKYYIAYSRTQALESISAPSGTNQVKGTG